jgi:hypothetical protein
MRAACAFDCARILSSPAIDRFKIEAAVFPLPGIIALRGELASVNADISSQAVMSAPEVGLSTFSMDISNCTLPIMTPSVDRTLDATNTAPDRCFGVKQSSFGLMVTEPTMVLPRRTITCKFEEASWIRMDRLRSCHSAWLALLLFVFPPSFGVVFAFHLPQVK